MITNNPKQQTKNTKPKVKELIEENRYSIWPRNVEKSGIEKIELSVNMITNQVDMHLYHRENIGLNHVYLDPDEKVCLSRHTKRLQNNIKRKLAKQGAKANAKVDMQKITPKD